MLKRIYIKNLAIIEESEIILNNGMNVFTGETGSGKSLIFQAINLVLGKRASFDLIRNGTNKCIIEVEFEGIDKDNVLKYIDNSYLYENQNSLIFRKEINSNGTSRSFLNDTPIQLNDLKLISSKLYDHHGQLQTTNLLNKEFQLELIDELSNHEDLLNDFKLKYDKFSTSIDKYNKTISGAEKLKKDRDYWEFQLKEILEINPKENEFEEIESELKIIENSEELFDLSNSIINDLYDGENNSYSLLNNAIKSLININKIDNQYDELLSDLESAKISIEETFRTISKYKDGIEFNPLKIEDMRNRFQELKKLIKKYGSIQECLYVKSELESNLNIIDNFDEEINKLFLEVEKNRKELAISSKKLSESRKTNSKRISDELNNELKLLGLEQSVFSVSINDNSEVNSSKFYVEIDNKKVSVTETGIDDLEFLISTNLGESMKALSEIASGGEMSRIMLAIKALGNEKHNISTLLLDEIDTGISGRIAQMVGRYMKKLSGQLQILTITHLPQIAANSDYHFVIEKFEENNRTFSKVKLLNNDESLKEIAKLFSGEELTDSSIESAKQLVGQI